MATNNNDRRVRKTKKALWEGLGVLLQQKQIHEITVRELTELVDINRSTFYLHYRDVYDLLAQIEDEVISEISGMLALLPAKQGQRVYPCFAAILNYVKDNPRLGKMLMTGNASRSFMERLYALERDYCRTTLEALFEPEIPESRFMYLSSFIIYGYTAMVTQWVENGMREDPEEIARLMEGIAMQGVLPLSNLGIFA